MEDILRKLISFQTITGNSQAAHELIEYVTDFVRKRGMHVERYISNGYESLVATSKPGDKQPTVMLAAHGDVVKAADGQFELRKEDGKLIGRGVMDMKCAMAAYLQVIDDIKDNIQDYSLGLMVTMDEEIGGNNSMPQLVAEGYRPKVCVLPDGGDNWQVQVASKGVLSYRLTAYGRSAHSSRHWEGDNALKKLLPILPKLEGLFPNQGRETNTLSVNGVNGGSAFTQVPNKAHAFLDVRTLDEAEHVRLQKTIPQLCEENGIECVLEASGHPTHFDLHDPYIEPFVKLIEQETRIEVRGVKTLATNDARFLVPHGIPCISFYPKGGGHHSPVEWIEAKAFEQLGTIIRKYVEQMAATSAMPADKRAGREPAIAQTGHLQPSLLK
jgi:succinyl-diaminopimelate desuccinylase